MEKSINQSHFKLDKLANVMQDPRQKELLEETLKTQGEIFNKWMNEIETSNWDEISQFIDGGVEGVPKIEVWLYAGGPAKTLNKATLELLFCGCVLGKAGRSAYENDQLHLEAVQNFIAEAEEISAGIVAKAPQIQEALEHAKTIEASLIVTSKLFLPYLHKLLPPPPSHKLLPPPHS